MPRKSKSDRQRFADVIREGNAPKQLDALRSVLLAELEWAVGRDLAAVAKEMMQVDAALPADPDRSRADYEVMRDKLAAQIDRSDAENLEEALLLPRDVAALARVLREVIVRLDVLPQHGERSNVVDLAERVRKKRSAAADRDVPDGSVPRDVRAGDGRAGRGRRTQA